MKFRLREGLEFNNEEKHFIVSKVKSSGMIDYLIPYDYVSFTTKEQLEEYILLYIDKSNALFCRGLCHVTDFTDEIFGIDEGNFLQITLIHSSKIEKLILKEVGNNITLDFKQEDIEKANLKDFVINEIISTYLGDSYEFFDETELIQLIPVGLIKEFSLSKLKKFINEKYQKYDSCRIVYEKSINTEKKLKDKNVLNLYFYLKEVNDINMFTIQLIEV